MQKLLAFIIAKRHWILFIFFEIVSFVLIYRNNTYQQNRMLSGANVVTGYFMSVSGAVFSYFDLQNANQELLKRNSELEAEVTALRGQLSRLEADTTSFGQVFLRDTVFADSLFREAFQYNYIPVGVVSNRTNYVNNYITVDKGANDGIRPDMGVVSPQGLVGIVTTVGEHYSVVLSLLSVKFNVNCKVLQTDYFGALSWKGGDIRYAYLEQLPTHSTFQTGDTIVTSGNSAVFPPGIMVGIVESHDKQNDDNFYSLKVRLASDFQTLRMLCVIDNRLHKEQRDVEKEARKND
jgi:rod shape-determining protein MreC